MLNILWLICCLPIFTAGAATTALYYTIFQYQVEGNDAVLQPFFHAFRVNFKQTTLLWIPLFLISILLIFDTFFLLTNGGKILQWVMLMLALMMDVAILTYLFPLIARFEMRGKGLLSTALSLCASFAGFVGHDFSESGSNSFFYAFSYGISSVEYFMVWNLVRFSRISKR